MKSKKPERCFNTGSIFELTDKYQTSQKYMFCQVACNKFVLMNLVNGNRYAEMIEFNVNNGYGLFIYPFSLIKKLAKDAKIKILIEIT